MPDYTDKLDAATIRWLFKASEHHHPLNHTIKNILTHSSWWDDNATGGGCDTCGYGASNGEAGATAAVECSCGEVLNLSRTVDYDDGFSAALRELIEAGDAT